MHGWTNADGEPIMSGEAYRFEMQLDIDSANERYSDDFYTDDDRPDIDPADCDHSDFSWSDFSAECDICGILGIVLVDPDFGDPEPVQISWKD